MATAIPNKLISFNLPPFFYFTGREPVRRESTVTHVRGSRRTLPNSPVLSGEGLRGMTSRHDSQRILLKLPLSAWSYRHLKHISHFVPHLHFLPARLLLSRRPWLNACAAHYSVRVAVKEAVTSDYPSPRSSYVDVLVL